MWKLLAACTLLHVAATQNSIGDPAITVESFKCSKLEGRAASCLACYPTCDDESLRSKKNVEKFNLTLTDIQCNKRTVCCIEDDNLVARDLEDSICGKTNPAGNPPSRRPSVRSVLEREYPWRAWVYRFNDNQLLCAATYIDKFNVKALVTTASCVNAYKPSDLYAKFTKTQEVPDRIAKIITHQNFSTIKGGNANDIAVLTFSRALDPRVKPVCLTSPGSPIFGSSCVTVSDSETSINAIIPLPKKCNWENKNQGVLCTNSIKGDYTPQRGAGLYCLNEQSSKQTYVFSGIYQDDQSTGQQSVYTTVGDHVSWIYGLKNVK